MGFRVHLSIVVQLSSSNLKFSLTIIPSRVSSLATCALRIRLPHPSFGQSKSTEFVESFVFTFSNDSSWYEEEDRGGFALDKAAIRPDPPDVAAG
jgi:hypothetical protein